MKLYPNDLSKIAEAILHLNSIKGVVVTEFQVSPTITVAVGKTLGQKDGDVYYVTQIRQLGGI